MSRLRPERVGSFALLLLAAGCSGDVPAPFLRLPLASALEQAGCDGKVVFLEFGASWCGPCKRLAATTLADPRVQAWLTAKTVPLRFDIDDDPQLATEFQVRSVPAMVFLRPDRTVLGTITGYRTADQLLEEGERRLQGVSAVEEAAQAVQQRPADLQARLRHFEELAGAGKLQEALEEAEYYWQASRGSMAQNGVRVSFFLASMERLAKEHPPAAKVLERWFGDARAALQDKDQDALQAVLEVAGLAKILGRSEVVVQLAERAKGMTLKMLVMTGGDLLLEAGRYQLLVDSGACDLKAVKGRIGMAKFAAQSMGAAGAEAAAAAQEGVVEAVLMPFEALAGVGREDEALAVAKLVLGGADDTKARERLAEAAVRAGRRGLAKQLRDGG